MGFMKRSLIEKKKIKKFLFFNLGPKNDWKKIINEDFKLKLENAFGKDLKELSYK
jgi:hypothetical protein